MTDNEIMEIKNLLEQHEKRIESLENLIKGKSRRAVASRKSIIDHVTHLKAEGFFNEPKTVKEIVEKLAHEGYHYPQQSLTEPLQRAVRQGILGRIKKKIKNNMIWAYCKR